MAQAVLSTQNNIVLSSNQPIKCLSETQSEEKGAFKSQDNAYSVANTLQTISFKYNTILLFETNYFMIL